MDVVVDFLRTYATAIAVIGISALLALSVWLTLYAGQLTLGNAAFMGVGAYVSALLGRHLDTPFPLALLAGAITAGIVAVPLGVTVFRLRGVYLAIATLAFGIGVERAIYHFKDLTGGPYGLAVGAPTIFGYAFNSSTRLYYLVLVIVVLSVLFLSNVVNSRPGRMLVAMRDSQLAASCMGINVARLKVLAFAVSAAFAALGGVLYAPIINYISVEHFTLWLSITFISMIVVGGLNSITGSFLGAAFVVLVPELLRGFGAYHQIIYGLAMIVVFVFWPKGLVGIAALLAGRASGAKRVAPKAGAVPPA